MNAPGIEFIFRGQRRYEWQLTPTLGRYTKSGVVDVRRAEEQKREFRLAMRGRGIGPELLNDDNELWAFGQHHGLATPLLDWTKSPFVALFFAFCDPDLSYEDENASRAVFVINKTALEALTTPEEDITPIIVQPLQNDHTRLVNQAGLFTISPLGSDTLVTRIMNLLAETQTVNMDDPEAVGRFIFKIHIPNVDRLNCLNMLRKMNIHHGSLFPDPIGASLYCNEWFGGRIESEAEVEAAGPRIAVSAAKSKPKPNVILKTSPPIGFGTVRPETNDPGDLAAKLRAAGVGEQQLPTLVAALEARYLASAPTDWVDRGFASAAVSVEIKRILRMNGLERERVEPVAQAVLNHFAPAPKPKNVWPFSDIPTEGRDEDS